MSVFNMFGQKNRSDWRGVRDDLASAEAERRREVERLNAELRAADAVADDAAEELDRVETEHVVGRASESDLAAAQTAAIEAAAEVEKLRAAVGEQSGRLERLRDRKRDLIIEAQADAREQLKEPYREALRTVAVKARELKTAVDEAMRIREEVFSTLEDPRSAGFVTVDGSSALALPIPFDDLLRPVNDGSDLTIVDRLDHVVAAGF